MTKIAHQVLEGERVFINLGKPGAWQYVSAAEAKRFAWALLSDLDPDEVAALNPPPPNPGPPKRRLGRDGAWRQIEVLEALSRGLRTSDVIGEAIGISTTAATIMLIRLAKHGFAERLTRGRPRHPARWAITQAGRTELAEIQIDRAAA